MRAPAKRWSALAWGVIALALCACGDDNAATDRYLAAADGFYDALCGCGIASDECERGVISDCERAVIQEHGGGLGDYLDCATAHLDTLGQCLLDSDCGDRAISACLAVDADEACGEPPEPASDAIQRDLGRLCLEPIECFDGSTVEGRRCNGLAECTDGSDEGFCDSNSAAANRFTCDDGGSVPQAFVCDGVADCRDRSDEMDCWSITPSRSSPVPQPTPPSQPQPIPQPQPTPQPTPMYECSNGAQIPIDRVCDGRADCVDGWDEFNCFACSDGRLIRSSMHCDGVPDCLDGTDELACPSDPQQPQPDAGVPDAGTSTQCTTTATQQMGALASASCAQCACTAAPEVTLACNATCWSFLGCAVANCASDFSDTTCIVASCADYISAVTAANAVYAALGTSCGSTCPMVLPAQ